MKLKLSVFILFFILFLCSPLSAQASLYSGTYSFSASTLLSGSSTSDIKATPGMIVNLEATSSVTYNGPISVYVPSFKVDVKYTLRQGQTIISTSTDSIPINSQTVDPGKTYTQTGNSKYALPSNIAPGTYELDCLATVNIPIVGGQTYPNTFTINVVSGASTDTQTYVSTNPSQASTNLNQNSNPNDVYSPTIDASSETGAIQDQNGYQNNQYSSSDNGHIAQSRSTSASLSMPGVIILIAVVAFSIIILAIGIFWYKTQ